MLLIYGFILRDNAESFRAADTALPVIFEIVVTYKLMLHHFSTLLKQAVPL